MSGIIVVKNGFLKAYIVLELADLIIWLDSPLYIRKWRIFSRYVKQLFKIERSHYLKSLHMLRSMYIWTDEFENNRATIGEILKHYEDKLIVVKSNPNKNKELYEVFCQYFVSE